MKKQLLIITLLCLALVVCSACGRGEKRDADTQLPLETHEPEAQPSAEISFIETEDSAKSVYTSSSVTTETASAQALQAAGLYQDIYESLYSGGGFELTEAGAADIISRLGEGGYAAVDSPGSSAMVNSSMLTYFITKAQAGEAAELTVYELCMDAGLLCHSFHFSDGNYTVTRTRLAWLQGDGSGLQGKTATVTYSDSFEVTELRLEGDCLLYDYFVPNNPPGTNHDGHIDTLTTLRVF